VLMQKPGNTIKEELFLALLAEHLLIIAFKSLDIVEMFKDIKHGSSETVGELPGDTVDIFMFNMELMHVALQALQPLSKLLKFDSISFEDKHVFIIDLPGVELRMMKIIFKERQVRIQGIRPLPSVYRNSKPLEDNSSIKFQQRRFSNFHFVVEIPFGYACHSKEQTLENGVLTITCPLDTDD